MDNKYTTACSTVDQHIVTKLLIHSLTHSFAHSFIHSFYQSVRHADGFHPLAKQTVLCLEGPRDYRSLLYKSVVSASIGSAQALVGCQVSESDEYKGGGVAYENE